MQFQILQSVPFPWKLSPIMIPLQVYFHSTFTRNGMHGWMGWGGTGKYMECEIANVPFLSSSSSVHKGKNGDKEFNWNVVQSYCLGEKGENYL